MLTASPAAPPALSNLPSSPDACVSLASILRCYYPSSASEIHHILLIIPVALELIFSTSLIFTNWRSGKRHLLLTAEGLVYFLLSLTEVLLIEIPAARDHILFFKTVDQAIGALSFTQLFFYMTFLYAFVQSECLPIIPSRIRRIIRPLLLSFIPTVIAMNAVASFAGVTYVNPKHVEADLNGYRGRFVWTFFSSVTLALFIGFQFSCFCFACYRLVRALTTQRNIETNSRDAAVLFKGIGWINAGIKIGAIETTVGFVFNGLPIAYVRRGLRLFSRALLCIGVAKGLDQTEDFKALRDELESNTPGKEYRNSGLRRLISNPRLSTFRQLSPTATAFHASPRAPLNGSLYTSKTINDGRPHPYSVGGYLTREKSRDRLYAQTPVINEKLDLSSPGPESFVASQRPTITEGLPGMAEFARVKAQRMSQYSPKRVTVYYDNGTPTLHLRFSTLDLPTPAVIARSLKSRPTSELADEHGKSLTWTPRSQMKERSRFSATSRGSSFDYSQEVDEAITIYPASTTHGNTVESENVYRYGVDPYGYLSTPSSRASDTLPTTTAAHGHSSTTSHSLKPPAPAFVNPTQRFSGYSEASSNNSAAQAEIVDAPRKRLSFAKHKSALARAVLYPVPSTQVAMALSGTEGITSFTPPRRLRNESPSTPLLQAAYPSLPTSQRPSPSPLLTSTRRPIQPDIRNSVVRESVIDDDGNVITVTAIASPDDDEEYDSSRRNTRAVSGYSVRSVPETLQAVRELAMKFPGPPAGAVVANIGLRAPDMTPAKERPVDEVGSSDYGHNRDDDLSRNTSSATNGYRHGKHVSVAESTDTEELIRRRIPAQLKMKGKMVHGVPPVPPPPVPSHQPQKRQPPVIPPKNPRRSQQHQQLPQQAPPQVQAQIQFTIDPFDDDGDDSTNYRGAATDLSPLSMSVNLRHPQSFISTVYQPSTRRNSGTTTALQSPTTPFTVSDYELLPPGRAQRYSRTRSQDGQASPEVIDFGTALEWDTGDQKLAGAGHRRSLSAQTRAEFAKLQKQQQRRSNVDPDVANELPDQLRELQRISSTTGVSLGRIKTIGKAPRRTTPHPTRGRYVRESMHLQPLVIPGAPSGQDVPISAVDAGGVQTILGVDKAGMSVAIGREQEQDDVEIVLSATTEDGTSSSNGRSLLRALSIEDGGYVPIKLQGSRRRRF